MIRTRFNRIGNAFNMLSDAIAVSAAVTAKRKPDPRHLRALGIDPEQFPTFRR